MSVMDEAPARKSIATRIWLAIILTPFGIAFIIAACLSGGPREVWKALTKRE